MLFADYLFVCLEVAAAIGAVEFALTLTQMVAGAKKEVQI